jgi:hypothetical protein
MMWCFMTRSSSHSHAAHAHAHPAAGEHTHAHHTHHRATAPAALALPVPQASWLLHSVARRLGWVAAVCAVVLGLMRWAMQ